MRHQITCRCPAVRYPHRAGTVFDCELDRDGYQVWGDSYRGTSRDVIEADCAERARDCECERTRGQV